MIEADEAAERARALVLQYVGAAGPECRNDYLKLLVKLAGVVSATLYEHIGPNDALDQLDHALDDIAHEFWRSPAEDPAAQVH